MKKKHILTSILASTLLLAGCGQTGGGETKSLYEHGLDLVAQLEEMAGSDDYISIYTGDSNIREILAAAGAGDYTEPKEVYEITIPADTVAAMAEIASMDSLSENLKKRITSQTHTVIATQINAQGGSTMLAASSVCTAGKTFVHDGVTENVTYLYTYENGTPVMVAFTPGENGAVAASGWFVFPEDFPTGTAEEIAAYFPELEATVDVVER